MAFSPRCGAVLLGLLTTVSSTAASAQTWTRVVEGLRAGTYPVLAVAPRPARDVYYSFLMLTPDGASAVWRGRVDDLASGFVRMPSFPLPPPATGMMPANVFSMTTNRRGEPVVGLSANGRSDNTAPMIMTWDESAARWIAPPVTPAANVCGHNLFRLERAPNGDLWGLCQWHGAYLSTDDGRSFRYLDVSALVRASHPTYFPTRALGANDLGALYSLAFTDGGEVLVGTETGGVVRSIDRGATWHPADPDADNVTSALAVLTNLGNVYGLGVLGDGRLVVHGFIGHGSTPAADATHLYVVDRATRTFTVARGVPDGFLGGRLQFAVHPTEGVFLHSGHDSVDAMGRAVPGGIFASRNGVDWAAANGGIRETFMVPGMALWVDGNGRGDANAFALDGRNLYTATTSGRVYRLDVTAGPLDAGAVDASSDAMALDGVAVDAGSDASVRDATEDVRAMDAMADVRAVDAMEDVRAVDALSDGSVLDAVSDGSVLDAGSDVRAVDAVSDGSVLDAMRDGPAVDAGCGCRAGARTAGGRGVGWILVALVARRRRARAV